MSGSPAAAALLGSRRWLAQRPHRPEALPQRQWPPANARRASVFNHWAPRATPPCLLRAQLVLGCRQLAQRLAPLDGQVEFDRVGLRGWRGRQRNKRGGQRGEAGGACGPAGVQRLHAGAGQVLHEVEKGATSQRRTGCPACAACSLVPLVPCARSADTNSKAGCPGAHLGKVLVGAEVQREMARQARLRPPRIPLPGGRGKRRGGGGATSLGSSREGGKAEPSGHPAGWQDAAALAGGRRGAAGHGRPTTPPAAPRCTHSMRGRRRMSGRGMGLVGVSRHSVRSLQQARRAGRPGELVG